MQTIVPHFWLNGVADEAASFYLDAFPDTRLVHTENYPTEGLPDFLRGHAGQTMSVTVEIGGYRVVLINADDEFTPNPAINFFLNFDSAVRDDAVGELNRLWECLIDGGHVEMELGAYPFSSRYGWVQDRYGVNWELMLTNPDGESRPFVTPSLMFCGPVQNRAAEAVDHYLSVFPDSRLGERVRYGHDNGVATPEAVIFSEFQLAGQWLSAMDSAVEQPFTFTPGVSLLFNAPDQEEIDRIWKALSAEPDAEQCGWLRDRYGVSWQIVPANLNELLNRPDGYQKFLRMKKIEIDQF